MSFTEITDALGQFVLVVLALSTLLTAIEVSGLLPTSVAQWLARNRTANTIAVLRHMGWDPKIVREAMETSKIRRLVPFLREPTEAASLLDEADLRTPVRIGGTHVVPTRTFVDVMGRSTDSRFAIRCARVLAAKWRELVQLNEVDPAIDAIAGVKSGSPLVAYELAKILDKPLVLHIETPKFTSDELPIQHKFDTGLKTISGLRLLLVDDSTTGGTKAVNAVTDIRNYGGTIDTMLVLFVPSAKNPQALLAQTSIKLYSATEPAL